MKKILASVLFFMLILFSCASTPPASDDLDIAIRDASDYLNDNIPKGNKIVILNIQSDYTNLSDYIIDELIANAVKDKVFSVVDRAQLEQIRMELKFQWSGEVDDKSALEIGKFLGAQTIVSGAVSELGDRYRMRLRALNVQTAQVQGQYNRNITAGKTIADLKKGGKSTNTVYGGRTVSGDTSTPTATTQTPNSQPTTSAKPATPIYKIGDTGPAGGLIFYDKGNSIGGWRYLEAAPSDLGPAKFLTESPDSFPKNLYDLWEKTEGDKGRAIGKGIYNTEYLMGIAQARGGFNWAVRLCDNYEVNGYNDWFLPSRDELNFMYGNLHLKGLGNFRLEQYWSSTGWTDTWGSFSAWYINFENGAHDYRNASQPRRFRPVRQF
jgi:TolB-like protein